MKIIGIDQSKTSTGIVEIVNGKLNRHANIVIKEKMKETLHLMKVRNQILEFIGKRTKDIKVVMEGFAFGGKGRATFTLGMLSGVIRAMLIDKEFHLMIILPSMLKKFVTGIGNIHKDFILLEVYKKWNVEFGEYKGHASDVADAFGLAMLGWYKHCFDNNIPIKMNVRQKEVVNHLKKGKNIEIFC